jgi:mono/diheme cytochrome c family protein
MLVMKILTTIGTLLFTTALLLAQGPIRNTAAITAVDGESWLHHLHRSFDETSMGKTWRLGPPDLEPDQAAFLRTSPRSDSANNHRGAQVRTLRGSDLYRMNCQGCHGESGLGAPPEIGSLIDPVRATSAVLVEQRMKKVGMELSRRQTAEMVNQSRGALLKRLHEGGQDMPSFHHLNEAEVRSLIAYLNQLAGVPGAERELIAIQESDARIGELIVKSTCHTCHDATGMDPTPAELLQGAIPPLSALPARVNQAQLVRKVTRGAAVIMGATSSVYRGRMPVFSYLSEDEAEDVYEYLTQYPPIKLASVYYTPQPSQLDRTNLPDDRGETPAAATQPGSQITSRSTSQPASTPVSISPEHSESVVLPISVGLFAAVLLALGCWITLREFKRLAVEQQARAAARTALRRPGVDPALWVALPPRAEVALVSAHIYAEAVEASLEGKSSDWMDERRIS